MTVGEYEQRAVYKRYNVVDNSPDCVLGTAGVIKHIHLVQWIMMTTFHRTSVWLIILNIIHWCRGVTCSTEHSFPVVHNIHILLLLKRGRPGLRE